MTQQVPADDAAEQANVAAAIENAGDPDVVVTDDVETPAPVDVEETADPPSADPAGAPGH